MRRGYAAAHLICNIPPTEPKELIGGTLTKILTAHRAEAACRRYVLSNLEWQRRVVIICDSYFIGIIVT